MISKLKNNQLYLIPLKNISAASVCVETLGETPIFDELVEEKKDYFYALEIIYNRGYFACEKDVIEEHFDFNLKTFPLNIKDGYILCKYDENEKAFIEVTSNIKLTYFENDLCENFEDMMASSESSQSFENECIKYLKSPLIIDGSTCDIQIEEADCKVELNIDYIETLKEVEKKARKKFENQIIRVNSIAQIIADFENELGNRRKFI